VQVTPDHVRAWYALGQRPRWEASRHPAGEQARSEQLAPPGDWWLTWLYLGGRGTGKTRTGVEWAIQQATKLPRGALVAPTAADVRDTLVEGESGILACAPRGFRPKWEPSKRRLTYPNNCIQTVYSADQPDRLRGPQHHYALVDEWMAMKDPQTLLDMLLLGLRLGSHPQVMIATTPRPHKALKDLMAKGTTALTRGTTFDNLDNLAPPFREQILSMYEGTRLGRQELEGEVLSDVAGALFRSEWIRRTEVDPTGEGYDGPALLRVVTAIDPAVSTGEGADETGIITAGRLEGDEYIVLSDRSGRWTPDEWANIAQDEVTRWGSDVVVAEKNQGGDLVKKNLGRITVPVKAIHAKRAKRVRAEPISRLYEQRKVMHLGGLGEYETQLTEWVPGEGESPDRLDAGVYALTEVSGRVLQPIRSVNRFG
jgi:phage terminase large subunit-like protein